MSNYMEEFIEIYETFVERPGSEKLLDYLKSSDFFKAPASSRFHLAEEGGLVQHSVNVYNRLVKLMEHEFGEDWEDKYSHESVAVCALLHDLCKVNLYKIDYKNNKLPDGTWEKKPFFAIEDELPYGHGEKSVYIISGFMRLTREEAMAINWHMGGFDDRAKAGSNTIATAYTMYPLATLLHSADFLATYLDEKRTK